MSESKSKPSAPKKPELEIKPVQDLEPDESQSADVRGGTAAFGRKAGGLPPRFSDAALKSRVAPMEGALAKLRTLRV